MAENEAVVELPGKLNKDQRDAIRLETQHLTPKEYQERTKRVKELHASFLDRFGKYISHPVTGDEMAQRFVFMDQDTHGRFDEEWSKDWKDDLTGEAQMTSFTEPSGGFIIGDISKAIPTKVTITERLIKPGEEEPEPTVVQQWEHIDPAHGDDLLVHEMAHQYQDITLPREFLECGAYYYGHALRYPESTFSDDDRAEFYRVLLDKYGDGVHKLFFGSEQSSQITGNKDSIRITRPLTKMATKLETRFRKRDMEHRKKQIFDEFTPAVLIKLFPEPHESAAA